MQLQKGRLILSLFHTKIDGVPQFVSYFVRAQGYAALGGQLLPKQVYAYLTEHEGLTADDMAHVNQKRQAHI